MLPCLSVLLYWVLVAYWYLICTPTKYNFRVLVLVLVLACQVLVLVLVLGPLVLVLVRKYTYLLPRRKKH